jgi:enoyl-CoA hydratase/3-hydroxyacyl-CoA dehydrogenase
MIGSGDMGHGIGELALIAGFNVCLYDISQEFVEKGKNRIHWSLQKLAEKGKIPSADIINKVTTSISIAEAVQKADVIIEAAPENLDLKLKIFNDLEKYSPEKAIFVSNTSNMSINELANVTKRPERVCGLHFFNPPIIMRLVEIIRGEKTSDEIIEIMKELSSKFEKIPVVCEKDSPGFIANRINAPAAYYTQLLLDRQEYIPEELDAAAMNMGMKMGPYELLDYTGADILLHSFDYFRDRLSKDYDAPPKLKEMVKNNKLGKKTGEGVYKWPENGRPTINTSKPADFDLTELLKIQVNEGVKVFAEGLATPKDIDNAMKLGYSLPFGPIEALEGFDLKELTLWLDKIAEKYGKDMYRAHEWIRDGSIINRLK